MNEWVDTAISTLLRVGVLLSITVIAVGLVMTFVHHPEYVSSPASLGELTAARGHYPNTIVGVVDDVRHFRGQAIVMAGLLLLIATAITAAVLLILLIGFAIGMEGG